MFEANLKKYRNERNLTQSELADKLSALSGKTFVGNNIRSYESGTNPKIDIIYFLAEILNIPVQNLFDDSQETITKIVRNELLKNKDLYRKDCLNHRDIRGVQKVHFYENKDNEFEHDLTMNFIYIDNFHSIKKSFQNKEIFAFEILDDCMSPYVDELDIVLFSPTHESYKFNDGKYLISKNDILSVRNLTFRIDGSICVLPENNSYQMENICFDEIEKKFKIVGAVVGRILKN